MTTRARGRDLLLGRFLVLGATGERHPRGTVLQVIDVEQATSCRIVGPVDLADGDLLRREAECLRDLARELDHGSGTGTGPHVQVIGGATVVSDSTSVALVTASPPGRSLTTAVEQSAQLGRGVSASLAEAVVRGSARIVGAAHAAGWCMRTLSPDLFFVDDDGVPEEDRTLWLVAAPDAVALRAVPLDAPVVGYASPQLRRGEVTTETDDSWALAALCVATITASDLATGASMRSPLDRPLALLAPQLWACEEALVPFVDEVASARPDASTFESTVVDALSRADPIAAPIGSPGGDRFSGPTAEAWQARIRDAWTGVPLRWLEQAGERRSAVRGGIDLYAGLAGVVAGMALLWRLPGSTAEGLRGDLAGLVDALLDRFESEPDVDGGLLSGAAGVAVALVLASDVIERKDLVAEARRVLEVPRPVVGHDWSRGVAGQAWAWLALWGRSRHAPDLDRAAALGEELVAAGAATSWCFDRSPGDAYLGYAHGIAGVGATLCTLAAASDESAFSAAVEEIAAVLDTTQVRVLPDGVGVTWPASPGETINRPAWCHGATGVARFLDRRARLLPRAVRADAAAWRDAAALAAARLRPGALGPVLCHGHAGTIDLLLDLDGADTRWRREASAVGTLLEGFVEGDPAGVTLRLDQTAGDPYPGFFTGALGVLLSLCRLGWPDVPGLWSALEP